MKKRKSKRKYIIMFILLFIISICAFLYRYLNPPIHEVVKLTTEDGKKVEAIDELYLRYQLRLSQYIRQVQYNKSKTEVDNAFWSEIEKNNLTREEVLKDELLESTKDQLIILQYAKEHNITLDNNDIKKVDEELLNNSSPTELKFIEPNGEINKKIYRKLFENRVLSDKALEIGAKNEKNIELNNDETKVIICEELNIEVSNNKMNNTLENVKLANSLADKVYEAAKNKTFKDLSKEFNIAYKDKVDISTFNVDNSSNNLHILNEAKKLKAGEYTKPMKLYGEDKIPKSFIILKYINVDNNSSNKNQEDYTLIKKMEKFKKYLINKKESQDFDINKELFEELK